MSAQLFAPLPLDGFLADRPPQVDLYQIANGREVLFCEANTVLSRRAMQRLAWAGVRHLYARFDGANIFGDASPLRSLLSAPDSEFSPVAKAGLVYQSAVHAARLAYATPAAPESLVAAREAAALVAVRMMNDRRNLHLLLDTMENDTLYTHAVNVCAYATAIGVRTGLAPDTLRDLSLGAFLHDLGKTKVPEIILDKPGKLDDAEWATMRLHPLWGRELADRVTKGRPRVASVILQHHERLDGSGYPSGLRGGEIDPLAGVVAICDVYDALTSQRPYRQPQPPFEALELMSRDVPRRFSPDAFTSLVRALGPQ